MGVMLDPKHDPMPTENELARIAGLVPGEVDQKKLEELRQSLNEKGFMVTTTEDLFTWARTGRSHSPSYRQPKGSHSLYSSKRSWQASQPVLSRNSMAG